MNHSLTNIMFHRMIHSYSVRGIREGKAFVKRLSRTNFTKWTHSMTNYIFHHSMKLKNGIIAVCHKTNIKRKLKTFF